MNYTFYDIAMLFFTYSFLAWLAETTVATVKEKDFRNRGFASGPFCFIYGFTGVLLTIVFQDLRNDAFFLFLGATVVSTAVEWFTGKILEGMKQKKWWDYSAKRWNLDGYICLQYSLLWGVLGFVVVQYANGMILGLYHFLPILGRKIIVWGLTAIGLLDLTGSLLFIYHMEKRLPRLFRWSQKMQQWTLRLGTGISQRMENRIRRAYPATAAREETKEQGDTGKCTLTHLFWLFLIGALLGDIVETIFCRITMGVWMSRSSLVWGPFSVVWGLAIALITALLYRDRNKGEARLFLVGTLLGGAYEYICSVFTEIVFGKVFWDYSGIPFNLGGRINLLYCFFWGIAAVVWFRLLYPRIARLITLILHRTGRILTTALVLFMIADIFVSILALVRYDTRANGSEAVHRWEQLMDTYFDDARMERIYPNAIPQSNTPQQSSGASNL